MEKLISWHEACEFLNISPRSLARLISAGRIPKPTVIHRRLRFWRASVFESAIQEYEQLSKSG